MKALSRSRFENFFKKLFSFWITAGCWGHRNPACVCQERVELQFCLCLFISHTHVQVQLSDWWGGASGEDRLPFFQSFSIFLSFNLFQSFFLSIFFYLFLSIFFYLFLSIFFNLSFFLSIFFNLSFFQSFKQMTD